MQMTVTVTNSTGTWRASGVVFTKQEVAMHYQNADMALATEYIGLPNNFHLRNP
jgi:hypothetical protein